MNLLPVTGTTASPVALAIRDGNIPQLTQLLKTRSPTDVPDSRGWYPLLEATSEGLLECVEMLMQHAAQAGTPSRLNALTHKGLSPLMLACCNGHEKVVSYLIDLAADKSIVSYDGATAAHMISHFFTRMPRPSDIKVLGMLKKVIPMGFCDTITDDMGFNMLHHTIRMDLWETFQFLLEEVGFSYTKPGHICHRTPIYLCALFGRGMMLHALIQKLGLRSWTPEEVKKRGAIPIEKPQPTKVDELEVASVGGMTPLCVAIRFRKLDCIKILIKYGANPLAGCYEGDGMRTTPFKIAIEADEPDILRFVTDYIDMEQLAVAGYEAAMDGDTSFVHPLLHVVRQRSWNMKDLVEILAEHSDFLNVTDNSGTNILAQLLEEKDLPVQDVCGAVKVLLEQGVFFVKNGKTPSPFVCAPFSNRITKLLILADERSSQLPFTAPLFTHTTRLSASLYVNSLPKLPFFAMILHGADIYIKSTQQRFPRDTTRHHTWKVQMLNFLHPQMKSIKQAYFDNLQDEPIADEVEGQLDEECDIEFGGPRSLKHLSRLAVRTALGQNLLMEPFPYPALVNPYLFPNDQIPSTICSLEIPNELKGYLLLEDVVEVFFRPPVLMDAHYMG